MFLWKQSIGSDRFFWDNYKGIDAGGTIIFSGTPRIIEGQISKLANYSLIMRYNDEFRFMDSTRVDADILNITAIGNGTLYCLALKTTGSSTADSTGKTTDYSFNYFFLKSTDKGKTWDSVNINLPFKQKFLSFNYLGQTTYYYIDAIIKNAIYLRGNELLIPSAEGILYKYNFQENTLDSLAVPALINNTKKPLFMFDKKMFCISENNTIFYSPIGAVSWDSVEAWNIFDDWNNYSPGSPDNFNKDAIISTYTFDDTTGFMIIGRLVPGIGGNSYKTNIVKLSLNTPATNVAESKIEEERPYLWNSPPYPLPGNNIIASRIYWNSNYDISDIKISVHDINGTLLPEQKITIDKMQDYRAILQWNCKGVVSGVYIIKTSLAGNILNVPVVVTK
ncbi:hypothetical protein MASR2M18_15120 [Ignavibacteria bacterium]